MGTPLHVTGEECGLLRAVLHGVGEQYEKDNDEKMAVVCRDLSERIQQSVMEPDQSDKKWMLSMAKKVHETMADDDIQQAQEVVQLMIEKAVRLYPDGARVVAYELREVFLQQAQALAQAAITQMMKANMEPLRKHLTETYDADATVTMADLLGELDFVEGELSSGEDPFA